MLLNNLLLNQIIGVSDLKILLDQILLRTSLLFKHIIRSLQFRRIIDSKHQLRVFTISYVNVILISNFIYSSNYLLLTSSLPHTNDDLINIHNYILLASKLLQLFLTKCKSLSLHFRR